IKGLPLAPDWKQVDPKLMNYYSINKSFIDDVSPSMKLGYHRNIMHYYEKMEQYDDYLTRIKSKILNAPVQYKRALIFSSERWEVIDIVFYSIVFVALFFIAFKAIQFCRRSREEEIPLLPENRLLPT
ncbi:hypothetical protein PMAYCL1PPCAC_10740, partial [Pristionchus mayeri]